jgi:hypothetical protein
MLTRRWHAATGSIVDILAFLFVHDMQTLYTLALSTGIIRESTVKYCHRILARCKFLQGSDLCSVIFVILCDRCRLLSCDRLAVLILSLVMICLFLEFSYFK